MHPNKQRYVTILNILLGSIPEQWFGIDKNDQWYLTDGESIAEVYIDDCTDQPMIKTFIERDGEEWNYNVSDDCISALCIRDINNYIQSKIKRHANN